MEKGYYFILDFDYKTKLLVAIHNKNGKGLLQQNNQAPYAVYNEVAIHNKNGKGLLQHVVD